MPTLPTTLAHLQLEHFLFFQLHPSLFFPGPLGLVLGLSQLLVPCFQLQPSYPERGERPRVRGPAAKPGPEPAHPALHPHTLAAAAAGSPPGSKP